MSHRLAILVMLLVALAAPAAIAQNADSARIDRLLEVMRAKDTLDALLPQIEQSQQQMARALLPDSGLDEEQRARIAEIEARSFARAREALSWEKMAPLYREIYGRTFSDADIDAMTAFYESQAGQNLLDKMPLLMQNTMEAVQGMIVPMMQQLERDLAEVSED